MATSLTRIRWSPIPRRLAAPWPPPFLTRGVITSRNSIPTLATAITARTSRRGFQAIMGKLPSWEGSVPAALFKNVAMTLISTVGGASGPLYGSFFLDASKAAAGKAELGLEDWTTVLEAGVRRGAESRQGRTGRQDDARRADPGGGRSPRREARGMTLADGLRRSAEAAQEMARNPPNRWSRARAAPAIWASAARATSIRARCPVRCCWPRSRTPRRPEFPSGFASCP